ncbi:MAG: hypothetical protein M1816_007238 [Peltula sp. TS41687]|nr:MAG: hypothetical protein M1816_007238 [Peltula sp. TS41687]
MPLWIRPIDDDELYKLYRSYMDDRDPKLALMVSYAELLLDAICSSPEAMLAGRGRLLRRFWNQRDDWQVFPAVTSAADTSAFQDTIKRVGAGLRSINAASGGGILTTPLPKGMPAPVLVP